LAMMSPQIDPDSSCREGERIASPAWYGLGCTGFDSAQSTI
jgi:hypothetical protein